MQTDMHYYGTYALARAAGLPIDDAYIVAYSAQYVDDSTKSDSKINPNDEGMLYGIATAHSNLEAIKNSKLDLLEQRMVWVPFHFFPGNEGDSLTDKLVCQKNSPLAQTMVQNNLEHALKVDYGRQLLGITAHVYADTFAHYGFSGISADHNKIKDGSLSTLNLESDSIAEYLQNKLSGFVDNYISRLTEHGVDGLGHAEVATYPDRPYLKWEFIYEGQTTPTERDNPQTFIEGSEALFNLFRQYAEQKYSASSTTTFANIKTKVQSIINFQGKKDQRSALWCEAIKNGSLFNCPKPEAEKLHYDESEWEQMKDNFHTYASSAIAAQEPVYGFHQAAIYHRYYTLKELLPSEGIIVI